MTCYRQSGPFGREKWFSHEVKWVKGPNFGGPLLPILRPTFVELFCNFRQFGLKKWWVFLLIGRVFRTHVCRNTRLKVIPFMISLMIQGVSELALPSFSTKKKIEVAAVFNISWFWPFLSWPFLDCWHSEEKPYYGRNSHQVKKSDAVDHPRQPWVRFIQH